MFAADLDVLVDPDWVSKHVDDRGVRFIEVDVSPARYKEGHLRGAVLWNAYADLRHPDYRPVSRADFQQILERSGIGRDTTVVLYGYGALLGFWLMKAHGHPDARIVNAQREELASHEGDWTQVVPAPQARSYPLPPEDKKILASLDDAVAATRSGDTLHHRQPREPGVVHPHVHPWILQRRRLPGFLGGMGQTAEHAG